MPTYGYIYKCTKISQIFGMSGELWRRTAEQKFLKNLDKVEGCGEGQQEVINNNQAKNGNCKQKI